MTMKVLVVMLALGIISGSQIFVLSDEPDSKQDQLKQLLEAYFRNLTTDLNEKGDIVRRSEFGAGLLGLMHGGYAQVSRGVRKLETELPTEVTEGFDTVVGVSAGVAEKGLKVLYEAWRKEDFEEQLKSALADLYAADQTRERYSPYVEHFLRDLIARSRERNEKINEKLKQDLDKLSPYAQEVQSQVNEFQELVRPFANQAAEVFKQAVEKLYGVAKPYVAPLLKPFREHTAEFRKWVSAPVFPPEQ